MMEEISIPGAEVLATSRPQSPLLAVITGRNEHRHVGPLFDFYASQGIDVAYLDDGSVDGTLDLALDAVGSPVVLVASKPYSGHLSMTELLTTKETIIRQAPYKWVMHTDMDEYRIGVDGGPLLETLAEAESVGANAVNFQEYTFLPVAEAPNHDHDRYRATMHWYFAFSPRPLHRLNAFMPSALPDFDLVTEAGHRVRSEHLRTFDHDLVMEHYVFLSLDHFAEQYIGRRFSPVDIERGWHGNRINLTRPVLPLSSILHDQRLDGYTTIDAVPEHLWTTTVPHAD